MTASTAGRARFATSYFFFCLGTLVATWATRIPDVKEQAGITPAVLGVMLLVMGAGAVTAMMITGRVVHALGSGRVVRWASAGTALTLLLPLFAPNAWLLAPGIFLFGLAQGFMDVSINAQGVAVERAYRRPVMSSMHALFSIGGLVGAGYASLLLLFEVSIPVHLALVLVPLGAGWLVCRPLLLPDHGLAHEAAPLFAWPRGALVVLSLVALMSMVAEGAVLDWSALYMREALGTDAAVAAAAFAVFSLTMTVARLTGDRLVEHHGDATVLVLGGLLAGIGLGLALFVGSPWVALAGFGCVGAGLANVVPLAFSRAGQVPGVSPGYGIAAVSTVGYGGFFVGPPAIGVVSDHFGLAVGLGLIPLLALGIAVTGGLLGSRRAAAAKASSCEA